MKDLCMQMIRLLVVEAGNTKNILCYLPENELHIASLKVKFKCLNISTIFCIGDVLYHNDNHSQVKHYSDNCVHVILQTPA